MDTFVSMLQLAMQYHAFGKLTDLQNHRPKAIVTLDGLIGAGKSTFLDDLQSFFPQRVYVAPEPVSEWQPELEAYYRNEENSAFTLQKKIVLCLEKRFVKVLSDPKVKNKIIVFERSPSSCKMFMELSKERFTEDQLAEILRIVHANELLLVSLNYDEIPHSRAYMDGTVELCMKRIQERARTGEELIPESYLYKLQEQQFLSFSDRTTVFDFDLQEEESQKNGFAHICDFLTPFIVPSITEEGQEGRKKRAAKFLKHVNFIKRLHYLARQLHRFR